MNAEFFLGGTYMRTFWTALFFSGIVLVIANELIKQRMRPPPVEYRYLPRDLDTYLREDPMASAKFNTMFTDEDVVYKPR